MNSLLQIIHSQVLPHSIANMLCSKIKSDKSVPKVIYFYIILFFGNFDHGRWLDSQQICSIINPWAQHTTENIGQCNVCTTYYTQYFMLSAEWVNHCGHPVSLVSLITVMCCCKHGVWSNTLTWHQVTNRFISASLLTTGGRHSTSNASHLWEIQHH